MASRSKIAGVIKVPFSTSRTTFFPKLEKLVLLGLHLGVHLLIKLGRHLCMKKRRYIYIYILKKRETLKTKLSFFFDLDSVYDKGGRLQTKEMMSQSSRINKVIKALNCLRIFSGHLDTLLIYTLKPEALLNGKCTIKGQ